MEDGSSPLLLSGGGEELIENDPPVVSSPIGDHWIRLELTIFSVNSNGATLVRFRPDVRDS